MNILVFCDEDLGVAGGGAQQVVQFVRALEARGHILRVVAPRPSTDMKDDAALFSAKGLWVWVPRVPMIRPWAYLVGSAIALLWTMWREKPDVMLWFDSPGQIAPLICAGVMRCPYVLFVNGVAEEELTGLWGWKPIRNLIQGSLRVSGRRAQAVVSVCREIPLWMQREWGIAADHCHVIRNGVDPSVCVPRQKEEACHRLGLDRNGLYIGFVGGFFPWHGLDTLVEAMTIVRRECPAVKLLLVGDGHTRPALQAMVSERGLEEAVSFVGRVPFDEVPWWIGASDVCVVLHRSVRFYPGDSMKLWEYLACARPVVATVGEGYGDTVERLGAGLSVKEEDPAGLAAVVLRVLQDPALGRKMGQAGRVAVVHSHTWDARAMELEQVCRVAAAEYVRDRVCA
jgi:glycosyltransferase involved in cell wall biosynthesis